MVPALLLAAPLLLLLFIVAMIIVVVVVIVPCHRDHGRRRLSSWSLSSPVLLCRFFIAPMDSRTLTEGRGATHASLPEGHLELVDIGIVSK
ncbi:MAG: hypothetical protein DMG69_00095 [Acidobacteria bacterium]|nr:MAG: hypothetical protein DMG69_00095 [Acidobacteriota bacterium]